MTRQAEIRRTTGETDIRVALGLDGDGGVTATTGVGFFDHMLMLFGRHGRFTLDVEATGDLETGSHHTVEDTGIVIGQALDQALADRAGIERYASAFVPMDETLIHAVIDISGRPHLAFDVTLPFAVIGGFETDLLQEFLRGLVNHAKLTLHVRQLAGENPHHVIEGTFKAVARALAQAVALNPNVTGIPSTKGIL